MGWGRKAGGMAPKLSVCCVSADPLPRTAAILRLFRDVADEIVCAVDARVPEGDLASLDGVADVLKRCAVDPSTGVERCLPWVYGLCGGQWILRIDNDEVPGRELLDALPKLVESTDVLQYVLPMRWLFPDPDHFIDELPWSEDWHIRLVRNDPVALRFPGRIHTDLFGVEPLRYLNVPLYHLDCVVTSRQQREQKAARYERAAPGLETMPGWSPNNHYRPEQFQRRPSSLVPRQDGRLIAEVLNASQGEHQGHWTDARPNRSPIEIVQQDEVDHRWPLRVVPESAYRATWHSVGVTDALDAGRSHRIFVEVSNDGTEIWPWGNQLPAFRLSYRWLSGDGTSVIADGHPTPFTADVHPGTTALQPMNVIGPEEPGEYRIQFALVHEGVRWFGLGPDFRISVKR